jgi:hypothetical protein
MYVLSQEILSVESSAEIGHDGVDFVNDKILMDE